MWRVNPDILDSDDVAKSCPVSYRTILGFHVTSQALLKLVSAMLVSCSVRDWTRFCYVIGFVADIFFSILENRLKNIRIRRRIHWMRVDGSRIRKEKVVDSKISGYLWTELEVLIEWLTF